MKQQLRSSCQDKASCSVGNLAWYVDFSDFAFNKAQCAGVQTQMFVQAACVLSQETQTTRRLSGLGCACVVVFMCLSILNYMDYIKKIQENKYIEWDLKTITSGDYTIEFTIE